MTHQVVVSLQNHDDTGNDNEPKMATESHPHVGCVAVRHERVRSCLDGRQPKDADQSNGLLIANQAQIGDVVMHEVKGGHPRCDKHVPEKEAQDHGPVHS